MDQAEDDQPPHNPYAPPDSELVLYRHLPPTAVDRSALLISMIVSMISPAVLLIEERLAAAVTCACLVGPPLIPVFTQRGRWRIMGMVICSSYTILGGIVGAFVYFTFFK